MKEKGRINPLSAFATSILFVAIGVGFLLIGGFDLPKYTNESNKNDVFTPIENTDNANTNQSLQLKKIEFSKKTKDCLRTTAINFVVDRSATMTMKQDGGAKAKIEYLKDGLHGFLKQMDDESLIGLQSFGGNEGTLDFTIGKLKGRRDEITNKINSLKGGGSTPMHSGLSIAKSELSQAKNSYSGYSFTLILLSDGMWNTGGDPTPIVNEIKTMGVRIFTIAYGSREVEEFMKQTASSTGDAYYSPGDDQIIGILNQIANKICN